jgi:hypothetical protein
VNVVDLALHAAFIDQHEPVVVLSGCRPR